MGLCQCRYKNLKNQEEYTEEDKTITVNVQEEKDLQLRQQKELSDLLEATKKSIADIQTAAKTLAAVQESWNNSQKRQGSTSATLK